MFMNRMEIEDAFERYHQQGKTELRDAAHTLLKFTWMIDQNSDGWGTWARASGAAHLLQCIVKNGFTFATANLRQAELRKALAPMKALCTRKNLPTDWLPDGDRAKPVVYTVRKSGAYLEFTAPGPTSTASGTYVREGESALDRAKVLVSHEARAKSYRVRVIESISIDRVIAESDVIHA